MLTARPDLSDVHLIIGLINLRKGWTDEAVNEEGEVIRFGREETRPRPPRLAMGLLDLETSGGF